MITQIVEKPEVLKDQKKDQKSKNRKKRNNSCIAFAKPPMMIESLWWSVKSVMNGIIFLVLTLLEEWKKPKNYNLYVRNA